MKTSQRGRWEFMFCHSASVMEAVSAGRGRALDVTLEITFDYEIYHLSQDLGQASFLFFESPAIQETTRNLKEDTRQNINL